MKEIRKARRIFEVKYHGNSLESRFGYASAGHVKLHLRLRCTKTFLIIVIVTRNTLRTQDIKVISGTALRLQSPVTNK